MKMTLGYAGKQSETGSYHIAQGGLKLMTFFFFYHSLPRNELEMNSGPCKQSLTLSCISVLNGNVFN